MRAARLLGQLEALAEKLRVQVVYERLSPTRSGLCRLHDTYVLFVDRDLSEEAQVQVFLTALSGFPLDHLQILPRVRVMLEAQAQLTESSSQ